MKKKVLMLTASMAMLLLFISTCFADYPIFYQRYAADPSVLEYNGRLYVYASHDVYKAGAGYTITDVTCISTDDMKNWTDHGEVFKASGWAGATWAPAVVYRNGKFYLYYGNGGNGIGVAVSSSPTEGFKDPLGRALVNNSTPGVNAPANFWCFDPGAFVDTDGQAYLYWGGNGEGNTRVIKLNSDMISVNGSASKITAPRFFEDSWINKYNGKYYYSYSTNFSQGAATIDYMMSDSPTSGFVHKGTILANPPSNDGNNNHHSIVQFKGNWYIAYHNHALSIQNGITDSSIRAYQRSLCMDRLYFNTDGTIKQVTITKDGMTQLKSVDPYSTNEAETVAQSSGIQTESCSEGGRDVCNVENGDWVMIKGVDFGSTGAKSFSARVAAAGNGGNIEIRLDSASGTLVGSCTVQKTGGSQTWTTKTCTVSGATGKHDLFLKFTGSGSNLLSLNWWKFSNGTTPTTTPTATVAPTPTPTVTVAPTVTPSTNKIECENMTLGGTYAGKIASPFTGVALYGNNDYCKYTQSFGSATHSFSVRGCSNNSGTAKVDLKIGGKTVGTFSFTGTTPTVKTLSNISHGTGNQEVTLTVTTDNGSWDAYVDYLQFN